MIATLCNPDFVMTASFPFTRPSSIAPRASARSTVDGRWVSIHCPGKRLLDLAQEWEGRTGARRSNYPPSGQVGSNAPLRSPSRRRKRSEIPNTIDHHWPLSIDENCQIFAPEIWDESEESPEAKARGRIKQVWFPGVHSDIGGGYPETGLSDLALEWMIKEAMAVEHPLIVDMTKLKLKPSHEGIQHDERTGWGRTWTEGTREGVRNGGCTEAILASQNIPADLSWCDAAWRPQGSSASTRKMGF
jgi:hypothetical protein